VHVYPIYHRHRNYAPDDDEYASSISNVISSGRKSLSSKEATALAETFRKVPFHHRTPSQYLMPLVDRPYPGGLTRVSVRIRGLDF